MAVVTASSLRKEIAGSLLFEGVSFSVERRDRLSLSGPIGAGKTTLLRMLAGESEVHGGEFAFAKGTRMALHDQRPPLKSGLSLREYALSGAADLVATEEELRTLEQAMASGDHGPAMLRRYSEAQTRLEHAGGYDWRERAARVLTGRSRRSRGASSRVPLWRERSRAIPTCCCSTSRRTTSTSRISNGSSRSCSLSTRRSSSSPTTAGSWRR